MQSDLLEEIYVEPPAEAQEPSDVVWRLHKAFPGLKGGPVAWGTRIDGILGSPPLNFRRSRVDPCLWTNSEGVRIGRHMDDFIKTGPPVAVEAVTEYLERVAQLKVTGVLDKFGKQARFLGSFITKVHGGYTIQTDTDVVGRTARPESGTLQTVETAWCESPDTRSYTVGTIRTQKVPSSGWTILLL